jgi:hypothetical protein
VAELSLREFIAHPASKATALVGVLGGVLNMPVLGVLWGGLWAQLGTVFTVLSIGGFTVAPEVSFLPTQVMKVAALVVAALYGLKKLLDIGRGLRSRVQKARK